jgi:hypothetical protein
LIFDAKFTTKSFQDPTEKTTKKEGEKKKLGGDFKRMQRLEFFYNFIL